MTQLFQKSQFPKIEKTFLDVSKVDDDVIVSVGSRLLMEESSRVHELVNDQRHVNAPLVQRHYLSPTRPPNITVTPVVIHLEFYYYYTKSMLRFVFLIGKSIKEAS